MTPSLQAMNTEREITLGSQGKMGGEDLGLKLDIVVHDPAVESTFADACPRGGIKVSDELLLPAAGWLLPRVQTEGGDDEFGVFSR